MNLDDKIISDVSRIFEDASYDIETILLLAAASTQIKNSFYLLQKRREIFQILYNAKIKIAPLVVTSIRVQYVQGSKKTLEWLAAFFGFNINQGFDAQDKAAVERLVRETLRRLDNSLATIGNAAYQALGDEALAETARLAQNERKIKKAGKKVEKALKKAGVTFNRKLPGRTRFGTRFIRVNGRNFNARKYAELVVKTESSRAYNEGVFERLQRNRWDIVSINATAATCRLCADYDDNTYSLTGENPNYPVLGEVPPYHPGCQHYLEPAFP